MSAGAVINPPGYGAPYYPVRTTQVEQKADVLQNIKNVWVDINLINCWAFEDATTSPLTQCADNFTVTLPKVVVPFAQTGVWSIRLSQTVATGECAVNTGDTPGDDAKKAFTITRFPKLAVSINGASGLSANCASYGIDVDVADTLQQKQLYLDNSVHITLPESGQVENCRNVGWIDRQGESTRVIISGLSSNNIDVQGIPLHLKFSYGVVYSTDTLSADQQALVARNSGSGNVKLQFEFRQLQETNNANYRNW